MAYIDELRAVVGHRPLILVAGVALLFDEQQRLLLIRRADDLQWAVVGGLMEPGETTEQATRREIREEIGIDTPVLEFVGIASGPDLFFVYPNGDQVYGVNAVYTGSCDASQLVCNPAEVLEAGFFDLDGLPANLRRSVPIYVNMRRARISCWPLGKGR